jgi:tetratricopeptide (TPR) repeat protein
MSTDGEAGKRIRELRLEQGHTQADLLVPGLLSASYLSLIETGQRQPSPAVLIHLACVLGTTPEFLSTGQPSADWRDADRRAAFAEMALYNGSADEALSEFESLLNSPAAARARLGRARALESVGRTEDAIAAFEDLMANEPAGSITWAERTVDVLRCYRNIGDVGYAIYLGEAAMETFEKQNLPWTDMTIRLGVTLAGAHEAQGNLHRAQGLLDRMVTAADALGSPLARGSAYWNAALVAHDQGRDENARELAERAVALFGETDNLRNLAQLRQAFAWILIHGEPAAPKRAADLLYRARTTLLEVGSVDDVVRCESTLALATLHMGDPRHALKWARSACSQAAGTRTSDAFSALLTLSNVELVLGDIEGAQRHLGEAEAILTELPNPPWAARAWSRAAALFEELGDTDGALRAYRRALSAAGHRTAAPTVRRSAET